MYNFFFALSKKLKLWFGLVILILASYANLGEGARILAVFAFPGKSHFMMTKAIISELTRRGHEITLITAFPINEKLSNYKEILIEPVYDFWTDITKHFGVKTIFDLSELDVIGYMKILEILGVATTDHALKQPKVQEIINASDTINKYDLLLAEQFYQEAFLPLAIKYQIPVITACTFGYANFQSQMMGVLTPWSFVPHTFMPLDDKMTFIERIYNTVFSLYEDYFREIIYFPQQDELVKKYFSHLPIEIPSVSKMEKNISLMLLNSYIPLNTPRPAVPAMIPVGGVHILKPKPLPKDIKEFLDGAVDGAIYFSLGTNVRSADLPKEKLEFILDVFKNMKQRVVWKWEDDKIPKLPPNVLVKKWLPQNDILAHKNTKIFITHGGLMGTQEGIYHAVPMLGIPIYCDQSMNMKKAEKYGYGKAIEFKTFTREDFEGTLNELLNNHYYRENAERISQIFRDRPRTAMESAMYWIEYVIKYKGAPQLRSAGADLPWYNFYLLDILTILVLAPLLTFTVLLIICYKTIFSRKKNVTIVKIKKK
ncbi:UDP-glycosyltransferase UGT5-like [Condylostylus longicornis]|uniref:UDP-glycosyltransferase UGT5-like n=1 Tax=Condylostylus longicornis TaxID=2530218 RepID=UPI00244DAD93|nr:UDP-glycosyltransferase UGT5-like [Condylostylus longicornis]